MIADVSIARAVLTSLSASVGIYLFVLLVYVIFSWVPRPPEPLVPIRLGTAALVDPLLRPLRGRIPPLRLGGIAFDLSIIVLFIGARILLWVLGLLTPAS